MKLLQIRAPRKLGAPGSCPEMPPPVKNRTINERLHDRCWEWFRGMRMHAPEDLLRGTGTDGSSISSSLPWPVAAEALASGARTSAGFRRLKAVCDVVETVGPVDGRFYAGRIRSWDEAVLDDPKIAAIDSWGTPIRWPGPLLGLPRAFSPTTLRYLATALWLKREGYVKPGGTVIEVGVGFGGLAAMNAVVSGASTRMVDLPQVEAAARRMMEECGLGRFCLADDAGIDSGDCCLVSNYAFTELTREIQDGYLEKHLKGAGRGVIVSNAGVFAATIGGRSDQELLSMLRDAGLPAGIDKTADFLGPADHFCKVAILHWKA